MRPTRGKEIASGVLLVAFGAFAAWSAQGLEVGSGGQMGPGYFPNVLAALLAVLGGIVFVNGLRAPRAADAGENGGTAPPRAVPWRAIACVGGAVLLFGLVVRPLGLGPALAGAVALTCLASRHWTLRSLLAVTAAMVLLGWLVFVEGLRLPVPFWGTWLR
jgi:hypothetical protein